MRACQYTSAVRGVYEPKVTENHFNVGYYYV